jgi:hypothetical protein
MNSEMNPDRFLSFNAEERDWIGRALVALATNILNRPRPRASDPPVQDLITLAHEADGLLTLPQPRASSPPWFRAAG